MRKLLLFVLLAALGANVIMAQNPFGPIPSARQQAWHKMETYGFVHFSMNTFTDIEWGYGDKDPKLFNPTELDCRQWARICKENGLKGIIITAKHHDGFCLWPSKYTDYSVKNSPWRDGKGDLLRELSDACQEYGLKFGVYLSPWDRNHAEYGKPEYITYFRNQLRELLTNYGEIFEVWFDGANGGDGYYGGTRERRNVDRKTYYGWPEVYEIVRELQPNAMLFSDAGPDCRWAGNEHGWVGETNWSMLKRDEYYPGCDCAKQLQVGDEDGTHWLPAEVDVSIRPGWFYHESEDHKVRPLHEMVDIYYHSVGHGGSLLLNFPVDKRGLIHENDEERLKEWYAVIQSDFEDNLAGKVSIKASSSKGRNKAKYLVDGDEETFWMPKNEGKKISC
ncbi:alpha-L-fucosidase [Saccharicrinis sp. GN24d3]|uniref:alpha-L-fucosidase n=1 Tax=Saccharicrinis sp. GN24d3 TaxID=3458416 RepID=UPI0040357444